MSNLTPEQTKAIAKWRGFEGSITNLVRRHCGDSIVVVNYNPYDPAEILEIEKKLIRNHLWRFGYDFNLNKTWWEAVKYHSGITLKALTLEQVIIDAALKELEL